MVRNVSSPFHEDVIVGKAFDRRLMGRLLGYAVPYRGYMLLAVLLILLVTVLGLAGPYVVKMAIDGPLQESIRTKVSSAAGEGARRELLLLTAAFTAIAVLLLCLRFGQALLMAWIGQKVTFDLRKEVFSHVLEMPFSFYDRNPVGRLVTRITSDIEALNELFASGFVAFLADILVLVAIAALLLFENSSLALITLGALPLLLAITFVFRGQARKFYREQRGHLSHLNAFTQESIQGMSLIQVFNRERENQRQYETINTSYLRSFLRSVLCYSIYFPAIEFVSTGALVAVIWKAATQLSASPPALTYGDFFLFWYFLGRFFQPVRDMAERYNVLQSAMAAAERIFRVLDTRPELGDPPRARKVSRLEGSIDFENVWFAYRGEEDVLRDVSFNVEPGETVAIVGATGAGKSTIINLISRFYDVRRGRTLVDGVDVREYSRKELRRRIGVVLQDVFIFSRSVEENISLGTGGISREDVVSAAKHVNADRFIRRLAGGYDEALKERGRTLSVGERQLLSFARALVHDPDILVLDEATANVDSETETLIRDALEKLLRTRTSLVIAHRLSTVRQADRIIVLHKGEVRETGSHSELVAREGIYQRLYELQYR